MAIEWFANSVADFGKIAAEILQTCLGKKKFAIIGSMGSGKTTFVKACCDNLNVIDPVGSPTFALVHEYAGSLVVVYHFDLYRVVNKEELEEIGFEEYLHSDAYIFIEWPEIIDVYLEQQGFIFIRITATAKNKRIINLII